MPKTIAVILNTNQLGGAERSLIEQLAGMDPTWTYHIYYPELGAPSDRLLQLLKEKGFWHVFSYPYPMSIYKLSRQNPFQKLNLLVGLPRILYCWLAWFRIFSKYDELYLNGLKASLPIFSSAFLRRRPYRVFWHFRDFPSGQVLKKIQRFMTTKMDLRVIANSQAVAKELEKSFDRSQIKCLYNLTGNLAERSAPKNINKIGVASMLAPWKGIHTVILMSTLYEKELRALGVEKISVFGKSIYQTSGDHANYADQLENLVRKLNNKFVVFEGEASPEVIFGGIDLLIHPSIAPEPFGRVLLEAYKSRVPVLSNFEGGAQELFLEGEEDLKFFSYDYAGLYANIKTFCENPDRIDQVTERAHDFALQLESKIQVEISQLLLNETVLIPKS